MRNAIVSFVVVFVVGCGMESGEVAPRNEVATSRQAVVRVPTRPTELSSWNWTNRFVPTSAKSAYLVAVQDPFDATAFLAWGFDVRSGEALFFVHGNKRAYLTRLQSQFDLDVSSFVVGAFYDPAFTWGGALVVNRPPPPPPPGGNDWTVWSGYAWDKALELDATANSFGM